MLVYFALGGATKISFKGVLKKHKKIKMHLMLQLFLLTVQPEDRPEDAPKNATSNLYKNAKEGVFEVVHKGALGVPFELHLWQHLCPKQFIRCYK